MDEKTRHAIDGIYNGTLAYSIKKNSKYVATGVIFGSMLGFFVAGIFGGSRLKYAALGGLAGAGMGMLVTPNK